jgi:6,7-dimethyl-8-ribityllumazine synthase
MASQRIALVVSRYNENYVEPMLAKALEEICVIEPNTQTEIVHAPGSFEIPFLTRQVIERRKPDAVICLGVIFQGASGHANLIANSVSDALCRISVDTLTPVIHAVLLLTNEEQAKERCLGDTMNRGIEAARAAIEVLRSAKALIQR